MYSPPFLLPARIDNNMSQKFEATLFVTKRGSFFIYFPLKLACFFFENNKDALCKTNLFVKIS